MKTNMRISGFSNRPSREVGKAAALLCLLLITSHCASTKSSFATLRSQTQNSIYSVQETVNPDLKPSRDIVQQDFQSSLHNLLSGSTFDQRLWGRDCDCL